MVMLVVSVKQITKPTIKERFIICFLSCDLGKAYIDKPLGIEGF